MIYRTRTRKPCPWRSVRDDFLPPDILKILVVAGPTFGFLVLLLTAIPLNGAATLKAGFKNLFQAPCFSLKNFCSLLFIDPPSSGNC